jgi:hypothetical protein
VCQRLGAEATAPSTPEHTQPQACEEQFTGEEQADRAGAGDHDVIDQKQIPLEPWRRISEFARVITARLRAEFSFLSEFDPGGGYADDDKHCSHHGQTGGKAEQPG